MKSNIYLSILMAIFVVAGIYFLKKTLEKKHPGVPFLTALRQYISGSKPSVQNVQNSPKVPPTREIGTYFLLRQYDESGKVIAEYNITDHLSNGSVFIMREDAQAPDDFRHNILLKKSKNSDTVSSYAYVVSQNDDRYYLSFNDDIFKESNTFYREIDGVKKRINPLKKLHKNKFVSGKSFLISDGDKFALGNQVVEFLLKTNELETLEDFSKNNLNNLNVKLASHSTRPTRQAVASRVSEDEAAGDKRPPQRVVLRKM